MAKHSVTFGEESAAFSSFWALVRDADLSGPSKIGKSFGVREE